MRLEGLFSKVGVKVGWKILNEMWFHLQDCIYSWDLIVKGSFLKLMASSIISDGWKYLRVWSVSYPLQLGEIGELMFNWQSFTVFTQEEKCMSIETYFGARAIYS